MIESLRPASANEAAGQLPRWLHVYDQCGEAEGDHDDANDGDDDSDDETMEDYTC